MAGVVGRSGRKRKVRNIQKYFNDAIDLNSPRLIDITVQKALEGDREMIIYCWDRRLGKPQQSTNLDISGGEALTASLVANLFAMLAAKKKEMELEQQKAIQIEKTGEDSVGE